LAVELPYARVFSKINIIDQNPKKCDFTKAFGSIPNTVAIDCDERFSDGDPITVLVNKTQVKVRLYGIDCPENGLDFGTRAKQFAFEMVFGKNCYHGSNGH
jgi:endonuclease YncB( thermonuclease family)